MPRDPHAPDQLTAGAVSARPFPSLRTIPAPLAVPVRPVEIAAPIPGAIVTSRLVLRALLPADRTAFSALLAASRDHLKGRMNLRAGNEPDEQVFQRLLAATEDGDHRATQWRRAAFLPTGQPVGMVHILGIERGVEFRGDIGWWIGPAYCNNGLATEIVQAATRHALRNLPHGLGLHTLTAAIAPDNAPSRRVAQKAGYSRVPGASAWTIVPVGTGHELHEAWEAHAAL